MLAMQVLAVDNCCAHAVPLIVIIIIPKVIAGPEDQQCWGLSQLLAMHVHVPPHCSSPPLSQKTLLVLQITNVMSHGNASHAGACCALLLSIRRPADHHHYHSKNSRLSCR